jgi:hypothetical protein
MRSQAKANMCSLFLLFIVKDAPSPLLQFALPGYVNTGPTIDERGNTFFVRNDGVYYWSPVTNIVLGVRTNKLQLYHVDRSPN